MPHDESKALSNLRLENARSLLRAAQDLVELGHYKSAANRSYYAVFSAMRAELALLGLDGKKHSSVISMFRVHFIKAGILSKELSDIITDLFEVRTQSDYDDYFLLSEEEVVNQVENARIFINMVEEHLSALE
jgi:uncharacterized protein (UPF0332 family)